MRGFFYQLPKNAVRCFQGCNLLWHLLAIGLTWLLVASDFDWHYFTATRIPALRAWLFPAVRLGMFLPVLAPLFLLAVAARRKAPRLKNTAFALGQAAFLGLAISSFYKAFTGRIPPPHFSSHGTLVDTSHGFRFGFLRGGMFWGWPSSHTTVAFAMAVALWRLYPEKRLLRYLAILYAGYVGISVSMTIHWFSEFVAGIIIGSVIGAVVGKSFYRRNANAVAGSAQELTPIGTLRHRGERGLQPPFWRRYALCAIPAIIRNRAFPGREMKKVDSKKGANCV